jgi:hypothetical protein
MIFLKTDSSYSRLNPLFLALSLPILLALGLEVSFHPRGYESGWWWVFIDLEVLQYPFAALLAAAGGFFGIVVVAIASFFRIFNYAGEVSGYRISYPGSIGAAAALLSIAHLFAEKNRLEILLRAKAIAIPGVLLLLALCAVTIKTQTVFELGVSGWAYDYLLLCAFYYGLSAIKLLPGIFIVLLIGSVGSLLCGYDSQFCSTIILERLPYYSPENLLGQLQHLFTFKLVSIDVLAALVLVYVGLLGRGLRKLWLSEQHRDSIDRVANNLVSLPGLLGAAIISILIWDFSLSLVFGWQEVFVSPEGNEQYFRPAFNPATGAVFLIVPFVGFCMGALYSARGVWLAIVCFMALVLALQVGLALKIGDTSVGGARMFADIIKLYYGFPGVNLGRGLALPLYAFLGLLVAKTMAFYSQPTKP